MIRKREKTGAIKIDLTQYTRYTLDKTTQINCKSEIIQRTEKVFVKRYELMDETIRRHKHIYHRKNHKTCLIKE